MRAENIIGFGDTTIKLASLFGLSVGGPLSGTVPVGPGLSGVVLNPGEFGAVVKAWNPSTKARASPTLSSWSPTTSRRFFPASCSSPSRSRPGFDRRHHLQLRGEREHGTTISVKPQIAQVTTSSSPTASSSAISLAPATPPGYPLPSRKTQSLRRHHPRRVHHRGGGVGHLQRDRERVRAHPHHRADPGLGRALQVPQHGQWPHEVLCLHPHTVLRHNNFEDLKFLSAQEDHANSRSTMAGRRWNRG